MAIRLFDSLRLSLKTLIILYCVTISSIKCHDLRTNEDSSHNIEYSLIENTHNNNNSDHSHRHGLVLVENIDSKSTDSLTDANVKWRHKWGRKNRTLVSAEDGSSDFNWLVDDFVMTDNLSDGERERRIRFKGVTAKETAAGSLTSGLILRQLAEGRHFMQIISDASGQIIDCEYLKDKETVRKFIKEFNKEISSYFNKNRKTDARKLRKVMKEHKNYKRYKSALERDERRFGKERDTNAKRVRSQKQNARGFDEMDDYAEIDGFDQLDDIYRDDYKLLERSKSKREIYSNEDDYLPDYSEFDPVTSLDKFNIPDRYPRRRNNKRKKILADNYSKMSLKNITVLKVDESLPEEIAEWLNYRTLKQKCDKVHEQLKELLIAGEKRHEKEIMSNARRRNPRSLFSNFGLFPGMLWCGKGHIANSHKELGHFQEADACCRAHDTCPMSGVPSYTRRHGIFNYQPFTISYCKCDKSFNARTKRDVPLLIPGTKWCGKGYSATRHSQLGAFNKADRCCRSHDLSCPFWIGGAESKYGLFNWRPNTLMHCRCDERFRNCLKLANTDAGNMVGRLFFNILQTKCFVLKPAKVCLERSWWGKCLKVGYVKQAHLRENPSF